MNRKNIYLVIGIVLFIVYAIYYQLHSSNLLATDGRFTIGMIEKIEGGGKGGLRVYISFKYKNAEQKRDYIDGSGQIKDTLIGKRLFIKFIPDDINRLIDFDINCLVPDSIKDAPYEGWSKEWMQKHFPDCALTK